MNKRAKLLGAGQRAQHGQVAPEDGRENLHMNRRLILTATGFCLVLVGSACTSLMHHPHDKPADSSSNSTLMPTSRSAPGLERVAVQDVFSLGWMPGVNKVSVANVIAQNTTSRR